MDLDIRPEFKFEELSKQSELEKAQIEATYFDNAIKGIELGIFTDEDVIDYLQGKNIIPDTFVLKEVESEELEEVDELGMNEPKEQ